MEDGHLIQQITSVWIQQHQRVSTVKLLVSVNNYKLLLLTVNTNNWYSLIYIPFDYLHVASPILCGLPQSPLNGSLGRHSLTSPLDTIVNFQCDDGLFPNDIMTATCRNLSGRGEWDPNPADLVCRIEPGDLLLQFVAHGFGMLLLTYSRMGLMSLEYITPLLFI